MISCIYCSHPLIVEDPVSIPCVINLVNELSFFALVFWDRSYSCRLYIYDNRSVTILIWKYAMCWFVCWFKFLKGRIIRTVRGLHRIGSAACFANSYKRKELFLSYFYKLPIYLSIRKKLLLHVWVTCCPCSPYCHGYYCTSLPKPL